MKKFLFLFIFFLISCGYQPIYLNKSLKNTEFNKIISEGENNINKKIIGSLSFTENNFDNNLNDLIIKSSFKIEETSKNSRGQVESYRSQVILNLIIKNKNQIITNKDFVKEFSYNTKDNKFDLVQYQNEIKNNLINEIIEDIILYMNI